MLLSGWAVREKDAMNKNFHRVIWSAARAMRVVVQETANSTGRGSSKATGGASVPAMLTAASMALFGMLVALPGQAQIVGAPNVPGNLRPTVVLTPNGLPLVNIQTPSAAGVSRNVYNQFNVGPNGAVLNNSRTNVQTQLGGIVQGNPYLATGPARIILNEVNGGNPSQLRGYLEVAGQRAEVIIANPAGINVDGAGFINASRATLTTGVPQMNAFGGLDSFLVRGGTITINGAGLDVSKTDYAAILARAVEANAGIWASELKVVTGANTVSADHSQITPTAGTGAAPTFALDVAALGGMYAGKIVLIGTEAGLGVRNAGTIQAAPGATALAGAGQLVVTSAGRLENIGTIQGTADANLAATSLVNSGSIGSGGNLKIASQGDLANSLDGKGGTLEGARVELASAAGNIDNRNGGTVRQTGSAALGISAPALSNTGGGVIGLEPIPQTPSQPAGGTGPGTGGGTGSGTTSPSTGPGTGTPTTGTGGTIAPAPYVAPSPGTVTAAGAILNDGGRIYAGGPITLQSANINNNGGTLSLASMTVNQPTFDNHGGTLNIANGFSANVGSFDNTGGKLNAGSLSVVTSGDLINTDGTLTSATDANLTVGGKADNTRGSMSAAGALTVNVAGATLNNSGTLASNQALTLNTSSLENTNGSIQSAQAGVQLGVTNQLVNGSGGSINAATDLNVQAGSLANGGSLRGGNDVNVAVGGAMSNDGSVTAGRNTTITVGSLQGSSTGVLGAGIQNDGKLGGVGDLRVTSTGALVANGTNLAAGNATLQGASVDLSASQTSAANIAVMATQGNVTTSGATVVTPGTLAVTANSNPAQTLVNDAGRLNAAQLQINVSNLANTNGGEIVQTGTGATTIATSGTLNNDGGRIASNGQDLTLQGASIGNATGKIEHAGTGTLSIAGGSFNGANGQITTNGALAVGVSAAFNQDGGTTSAKQQIAIDAGSLSNRGGQIVQTGADATRIAVVGALDNTTGTIASNGNTAIAAGSLTNQGGVIRAAETSSLDLTVGGLLDNSNKGVIGAGGNTSIAAGSLNNNAGSVTAVGDLGATIAGAATNAGGTLAANGNTTVTAASLDNSAGTTAAVNGNLSVTTTGQTINNGGTLQAGGVTALSNGGLLNQSGKVFGDSLTVDTHGNALDNSANGTLAATTTVAISSGALTNDAGLIQSGGAMAINTNGQSLSNTNAAGYSNQQGGITSADTLDLKTGAVNNAAGFIGAKNALTANTQAFTNTGGGVVLGQSSVAINTNGTTYNNSGGKTQAVGDLSINAADIQNASGLLRSLATTTLNAGSIVNTNTQGTDQGIEGKNVVIGTGNLNNDTGAIRADVNATVTGGGTVSNKNGLISAGDTLAIVDPNAANPGAKTLNLVNTNGTLVADKRLKIDSATFSGDGRAVSGKDLSIALTQDIVNNGEVAANGNLSYTTTGNFTNNGKLLAGQTLTVGGNNVDNTANAEMSGTNTTVNASGTLINRGLIDSQGKTQINAGTLNNIGTGRIYGDAISVAVGTLNNDAETVGGVTKAATIAARDTLDIGATTINNREHALLFSAGDMFIGGALDANRQATGQGAVLNNLSADIESLGAMSIAMGQINNWDTHVQLGPQTTTTTGPVTTVAPVGGSGMYTMDQVVIIPGQPFVWARNPDGSTGALLYSNGYGIWNSTFTTTADTAINADPARIVSGGNMTLDGQVSNKDSRIIAGGTLQATSIQNTALRGTGKTDVFATVVNDKGQPQPNVIMPGTPGSIDVGRYEYIEHANATQGYAVGSANTGSVSTGAAGTGGVGGGTGPGVIVQVPANVGAVVGGNGNTAGNANGANGAAGTGATQTTPMVVRTSMPNVAIPQASLFGIHTGPGGYLIETDPRFANYRNWLSSDYLLNNLGLDPNNILKRLGDGFYEQKLIREQVAQLTGYRYLDGYSSDEDQYTALMNAGVTFAKEYGLRPGIALTPAQMAQLTSDIVWLVEQTVTLPDGSTQQVLVPQVYVRVRPGDIDGSGALLAGNQVKIDGKDHNLVNTGTIAGRQLVSINANTIDNLGGRISGGQVDLKAQLDINNLGGTIDAGDKLTLDAGRDINVRTTTGVGALGNTGVDRIAGLYVTNPGGALFASAGHDINLVGATVSNQGGGTTSFKAKNDINLGTVTTSSTGVAFGDKVSGQSTTTRELGTTITTNGTTLFNAGQDINVRQGTVDAGKGLLSLHADRDVNIASGQTDVSGNFTATWRDKGTFSRTDNKLTGEYSSSTSVGSRLSGGVVAIGAARDISIEGSHISGTNGVAISAGRDLAVVEGRNTSSVSTELQSDKKGIGGLGGLLTGAPTIPSLPYGKASTIGIDIKTDTASASTISSSQGGVLLEAGNTVFLQGAQVDAAKDIKIKGGNVVIQGATNSSSATASNSFRTKGIEPGQILWHDPSTGINARKTTETKVEDSTLTRTTLNGANVFIEAEQTLAMAGTTVNTPGELSLKADQLILGTQTTEHSEQTTSQGRDLAYQKNKDKGQSDQTTNYNQFNTGKLTVTANHIQAGLGARDSVEQLAKQPGMGWVDQLSNDPKLRDKIDWKRVEEAHKNWNYDQQGLTPEGAAIVTIVVAYFTAGAASEIGAAAGEAAGTAVNGGVAALGEGGFIASTGFTVSTAVSGAVTAGITALASQAAVALINNQGDIAGALHDLGSSANVKNLLTAIVTGGVLGGLDLNPTGLPTAGGGSQPFFTQLSQNLTAGAARAVIGTAINGGSFEENLKNGLKNAILDTVAAQAANAIGNLTADKTLNDFTNKVAHAIAGCVVGAARADSASGCAAGALGAAIGELAAEAYGRRSDTVQFAAMVAGLAVAITGGDASQINLGSQAGGNAAANNFLNHDEAARREALKDKQRKGTPLTASEATELENLEVLDIARDLMFKAACKVAGPDCDAARRVLNSAINTFAGGIGAMQDSHLSQSGNIGVNAERDQNLALANDARYAAQSLWDSFTEFAAPQIGGYLLGGALGAYFNEARAIYVAIKSSGSEIAPAVVQEAVNASVGATGSAASVLEKVAKESAALIANRQTSGQAYAVAGNTALGIETSGFQNIPAKVSNFPGIQTAKDGTFSIVDKELFMEGVVNAYNNAGQTMSSLTIQQIEKYIGSAARFPIAGGVPGLHAEVQAANALYNMMGPQAASHLNGVVVATTKLGASSAAGQQGGAFIACTHCSGILPSEVNVITGRRQ